MKAGVDGYILKFIVFADIHIHSLNCCFIFYGFDKHEIRMTRKGVAGQEWNMPYLKYMKHKQQQNLIHGLIHLGWDKDDIL